MPNFIGYSPFKYQSKVHQELNEGKGKIITVKAKRQCGKTTMAENELLRYSINCPNTISCLIEPTLNNSRKVFKELVKAIEFSGIIKKKNETLLELELINGSTILFRSAEQGDNLRGMTISGILIIDEAAYINKDVYELLLPTVDVYNAPILIISTPKYKSGFFYDNFLYGNNDNYPNYVSFDWALEDTSMLLSDEKLEMYRKTISKNKFTTDYLGEFLDGNGDLFINISACIYKATEYKDLYVGIDWGTGSGQDYTSITILNEKGQMVDLFYFNNITPTKQINKIASLLKSYMSNISKVQVEYNSIGSVYYDYLKQALPNGVQILKFVTTNQSKARLVEQLAVALENQSITLINDNHLLNELRVYEADQNPKTGTITYNAPSGFNDDTVISTMLAYDLLTNKKGTYNIK